MIGTRARKARPTRGTASLDTVQDLLGPLATGVPTLLVVAVAVVVLAGLRWLRDHPDATELGPGRFHRQLYSVLIVLLAVLGVILTLPVDVETRGQLLSLFGLVVTATIALASTTFVSNAMAGLMLRSLGNFRPGDFIRVGDHFGRVTERGLLHTEIQTEDRDLLTLPNLFLANQPVRVVRQSGTLVACELSLGYDAPRVEVERLLLQAADAAGLTDAFVQVRELGDFAVTWRVSGFLAEVKHLLSVRSALRVAIMDALHGGGIEIVSPAFMNQRSLDPQQPVLAPPPVTAPSATQAVPEAVMFDKAELAARLTGLADQRSRLAEELAALEAEAAGDEEAARRIQPELTWRRHQLDALDEILEQSRSIDEEH